MIKHFHRMLKNLQPRLYQETITANCCMKNSLVVLPTGMGKSIIFTLLTAQRLQQHPSGKILILAPTKPLCEQHQRTVENFLGKEVALFTGSVKPEKRKELFKESQIIVSTPQGLENDIISRRINFSDVSLLVFDECHRAVKDYAYVWIAQYYMKHATYPLILGLTASPGNDMETIQEVVKNLGINHIEVRTEDDPDVKPYIQDVKTTYAYVDLPEDFQKLQKYIKLFIKEKALEVKNYLKRDVSEISRKEMLGILADLRGSLARGEKDFDAMKCLSVMAQIMKMQHALELLECQGITSLRKYFQNIEEDAQKKTSKAVKNIVENIHFRSAKILALTIEEEHPKLEKLFSLIKGKCIIFNNFRDNALMVVKKLQKRGISAELFVGQAKKNGTGMSQKEQIALLERFRNNEFQVIVMTSVGEEGIDIPSVDKVIFYEPVPSAIRHIQRRGRTGRMDKGEVTVLVTRGTRDEAYKWSSIHKEKKMKTILSQMKGKLEFAPVQSRLNEYTEELTVFADHREKSSRVIKELMDKNISVNLQQLDVADYIISNEIGIEYKTVEDFVNSIVDGRLIEQVKELKYNFSRPLIIIEGQEDLYSVRNIHPNAVRGMLASITTSFGIPILQTKNTRETVEMIISIAKREQSDGYYTPHTSKKGMSLKEQQEYFISALPNVGLKTARKLLEKFGSPEKVMNASVDDLKEVDKIGEVKAQKLKDVFKAQSQ